MPDVPTGTGDVPYVVEDEIDYSDHAPWNSGADGFGFSLTRTDLSGFGNDPGKWAALAPTPGAVSSAGALPVIALQPRTQSATLGQNLLLSVIASGAAPLNYQWLFNGQPLPLATGASLDLSNLQPTNSGAYSVVVFSSSAATTSDRAFVNVVMDTDGDGMPDDWEFAYGLNPFDPNDALQDADGDGFSNRDEYLAGTNPRAAQSYLNLAPTTDPSAGISFFTAPNRTYTVLYSDSLSPVLWKKWMDIPASEKGGGISIPDNNPISQRYYRIVTPAE